MSQAGRVSATSGAPSIPTSFVTDSGTAVPAANIINVLGLDGCTTSASGNTINVSAGGGFTWTEVTGATQTIAVQNGYITNRGGGVTYTLPSTASIGDAFEIVGKSGLATITPNAGQQLLIGSVSGTVGVAGTVVSTNAGDCITFICTTSGASTVWRADSVVGSWTVN